LPSISTPTTSQRHTHTHTHTHTYIHTRANKNRELLLPPKLAAKAPADLQASIELLRQVLDGGLHLDPAKRLTPSQALALFGAGGGGRG